MTLLVTVDMTQVLASPIGRASNIGGIDIGGWGRTRVVPSLLVFTSDTLNRNYEACVLLRGIVLRFPSRGGLGLGFDNISEAITLPATLIYLSEDGRG